MPFMGIIQECLSLRRILKRSVCSATIIGVASAPIVVTKSFKIDFGDKSLQLIIIPAFTFHLILSSATKESYYIECC